MSKLNRNFAIAIAVLVLILIFSIYYYYTSKFGQNLDKSLIKVPFANQTIDFRVQVTTNMVSYMKVPKTILNGDYYLKVEEIVGKCVRNDTRVVEGSIFYKEFLTDCEDVDLDKKLE